jgi:hypothetical protein
MNKEQTPIEWIFEQFFNSFEKFNNGEYTFNDYFKRNLEIRKQAKEMEEEEKKQLVIGTYIDLKISSPHKRYGMQYLNERAEIEIDAEKYYKKTFKQKEDEK